MDLLAKLNKALKSGSPAHTATLIHENEVAILDAAKTILSKSEVGASLLLFAQSSGLKLHVLKNKQDFGVLPNESSVYISCPAGQPMPSARAALYLAGAIREAQQDRSADLKRPDLRSGSDVYKEKMKARKMDELDHQVRIVYELAEVNGLLEIVDEFAAMGYLDLYEAYKSDLNGKATN